MTTFNTTSPRQRNNQSDYRGSYTQHLTIAQFKMLMDMADKVDIDLETLWITWFEDDYDVSNWRSISVNAAGEIIKKLLDIEKTQLMEKAFVRKLQRTEQEQHDYEMGWGF